MAKEKQTIVQSVILRPLAELVPNPKNPRTATEEEIAALAESIKANPDYFDARPIVLSNRTGVLMIIDGEQRSKAAKLLGMTEVPTILMEGLTEEQEDEIMVRGNTHAGEWDNRKLKLIRKQWGGVVENWAGERPKGTKWMPEVDADVKFTEILNEEHNYIVLYFDNSVDWLQVQTLLGIPRVMAYSTRNDGEINEGNRRIGVGRIFRGAEVLEKLKKIWSDENFR